MGKVVKSVHKDSSKSAAKNKKLKNKNVSTVNSECEITSTVEDVFKTDLKSLKKKKKKHVVNVAEESVIEESNLTKIDEKQKTKKQNGKRKKEIEPSNDDDTLKSEDADEEVTKPITKKKKKNKEKQEVSSNVTESNKLGKKWKHSKNEKMVASDDDDESIKVNASNESVSESNTSAVSDEQARRKLKKAQLKSDLQDLSWTKDRTSVTVFVGNLPVNTKRKKLLKIFSKFGKVTSIRFRLGNGGKFFKTQSKVTASNVIAFVDFENIENAKASLVMNGEKINENVIRVNLQSTFKTMENIEPKRTIFVGNLKYTVTDQILFDFFSCCGDIEYARTIQSAVGCKGVGYVCFKKGESIGMALELNNTKLQERPVRVERYSVKKTGASNKDGAKTTKDNKKANNGKVKKDKEKKFAGVKSTDKEKKFKKTKVLNGPKLLAKKIASHKQSA